MSIIKNNSTIDDTTKEMIFDTNSIWTTIINSGKLSDDFTPDEGKEMLRELLHVNEAIAAGHDSKLYKDCLSAYNTLMGKLRSLSSYGKRQDSAPRSHRELAIANGYASNVSVMRKREGPYRGNYGDYSLSR